MTAKHKYDELVQSMTVLGQQTAHCHAQATRLGLTKTAQWLNDVAHENSRRINIMLTDIESTLIGNELDAADALKGHDAKFHTGGLVPREFKLIAETPSMSPHNRQLEHYASLALNNIGATPNSVQIDMVANLTAGTMPAPSLENIKQMAERLKTLTPSPAIPLGANPFGMPDMFIRQNAFDLTMWSPQMIDPHSTVKINFIDEAPEAEECKFCKVHRGDVCKVFAGDVCNKVVDTQPAPPTEGDTK